MPDPLNSRRAMLQVAKRLLLKAPRPEVNPDSTAHPPRLTARALEKALMSRSRERILSNLDDMYREGFERAKSSGDDSQMASLDFAYRREQLYFEVLLDIRDAMERR
jgi:hypothetical protein